MKINVPLLEELYLGYNGITDKGILSICKGSSWPNMRYLNMGKIYLI